ARAPGMTERTVRVTTLVPLRGARPPGNKAGIGSTQPLTADAGPIGADTEPKVNKPGHGRIRGPRRPPAPPSPAGRRASPDFPGLPASAARSRRCGRTRQLALDADSSASPHSPET